VFYRGKAIVLRIVNHPKTHPDTGNAEILSETPPPPRLPWERRKHVGSFRAYWRTAKIVLFDPSQLEKFLDEPVNEKHARYFRSATLQFTAAITFIITFVVAGYADSIARATGSQRQVATGSLPSPVIQVLGWGLRLIGLFLATRSLEWFSRPKDFDPVRKDRAITLSCYICAPILIVTVMGAIASAAALATWAGQEIRPILYVVNLAWAAVFVAWYPAAVRAIHFTTGRSAKRTAIAALAIPVIWTGQQLMMTCLPLSGVVWYNMAWSFL
jgi:hypothetical protein